MRHSGSQSKITGTPMPSATDSKRRHQLHFRLASKNLVSRDFLTNNRTSKDGIYQQKITDIGNSGPIWASSEQLYELKKFNDEYEAHVSDEDFKAECFNHIEFEDKVISTTSTLKCAINCFRKKEITGPMKMSDRQSHELSAMTKLASHDCQRNLSLHPPPPDRQNTKEKRDTMVHINEHDQASMLTNNFLGTEKTKV